MSPHFPALTYRDLAALARDRGFVLWRTAKGSHEIWKNLATGRRTVIPNHGSQTIKRKTVKSILEDLGVDPQTLMGP